MADFPGIGFEWFGNRELEDKTFTRTGAILPSFVAPIIGFHEIDDQDEPSTTVGDFKAINTQPSQVHGSGNPGILLQGFYDLFWKDRLHIIPIPLGTPPDRRSGIQTDFAAGTVLSPIQTQYELVNTYKKAKILTTKALNSLTGVTLVSGTEPVFLLGGGASEVYTVEVGAAGPSTIDGNISHDFADTPFGAITLLFNITGSRTVLFKFEPQLPVAERWGWVTDVLESADGSEQRSAVRHTPKQTWVHTFLSGDEVENRSIETFLRQFGTIRLALPVWMDATVLTSPTAVSDLVVNVEATLDRDFRTGTAQGQIIILADDGSFEALEATVISPTSITVANPLLNVWPTGTQVYPLRSGWFHDRWEQTLGRINTRDMSLQFDVATGVDFSDETGFTVYKSSPVLEDILGMDGDEYKRSWDWNMIESGGDVSRHSRRTLRRFPKIETRFLMPWNTRAEFTRVRNWLFARRGKQRDFWLPSHRPEFTIHTDQALGTNIRVNELEYDPLHVQGFLVDVAIRYIDGVTDFREITVVAPFGGDSLDLTLDTASTQALSDANIDRIEFLTRHRLNVDQLIFEHEWLHQGFVNVTAIEIIE